MSDEPLKFQYYWRYGIICIFFLPQRKDDRKIGIKIQQFNDCPILKFHSEDSEYRVYQILGRTKPKI